MMKRQGRNIDRGVTGTGDLVIPAKSIESFLHMKAVVIDRTGPFLLVGRSHCPLRSTKISARTV